MKRIRISIDALVLKGFRHEDRHAIAEGLTQELTRQLGDREFAHRMTTLCDVRHLRAGSAAIDHGASPRQIGASAGRQIGKGIPS